MASPSAVGRRRGAGLPKQLSSEDQALNQIAKEAEARLAAKRAARAEARSIRMKELERKQKEADEQADRSLDDDDDFVPRNKLTSRVAHTTTLYSSEQSSTAAPVSDINLKESLREAEERYRKVMVNNAQLDNERQALQYQVECLKDIVIDLEENLYNLKDELLDKTKELNKITREHVKAEEELVKCMKLLEDRERILNEHDINLDGTLKNDDKDVTVETDGQTNEVNTSQMISQDFQKEFDAERESLLSEIETLRNEISELKSNSETDVSKRGVDQFKPDGVDLERSFVDVSHSDATRYNHIENSSDLHIGVFVNNNEKCEDFEVIDDSLQQGGNFEDKSFEESGRSFLSSVQTNAVEESMESEIPLEISVDLNKPSTKDEYDIVQMGDDTSKPITMENENQSNSVLKIDKYLVTDDDHDESGASTETQILSVDRYIALDDVASVVEVAVLQSEFEQKQEGTNNDNSSPANDMPFENIEVQNIPAPKADLISNEPVRSSLYLQDEAEDKKNTLIIEPTDVNLDETVPELNNAYIADDSYDSSGKRNSAEIIEFSKTVTGVIDEQADHLLLSTVSNENSKVLGTLDIEPTVIKAGMFTTQKSVEDIPPICDNTVFNHDIVELYDQIASISSEEDTSPTVSSLPESATFGVFGVIEKTETEVNAFPLDQTANASQPLPDEQCKKPKGWLVRVESFQAPGTEAPEFRMVSSESQGSLKMSLQAEKETIVPQLEINPKSPTATPTDTPVPKERNKKKKKKKANKSSKLPSEDNIEQGQSIPTPSVPDLLGYEVTVEKSPKLTSRNSDIPQQFLDVSNSLAADNLSDLSDMESGENSAKKKRDGSKKGNKKENCKTQ